VEIIGSPYKINRFIYAFLLPFIHRRTINSCNIFRGMQISGGIPALVAKILYRKRVVINYGYEYSSIATIERKRLQAILYQLLDVVLLPFVDKIIVTTVALQTKLKPYAGKLVLIPNSIDTTYFCPQKKPSTKMLILSVGRLVKQKNYEMLIEAVGLLNNTKLKLLLIGQGEQKDLLLQRAKDLSIQMEVITKVAHSKLRYYYRRATVFVLCSLQEGHPKVLLEAMSCGMAAVGNNVAGIKELITHKKNGLLIHNSRELASAIKELISRPPIRRKMGNAARLMVIQRFDTQKIWKKEILLLTDLAT
jgi:glycosyltransferase involved in cell wall biosynthesis